ALTLFSLLFDILLASAFVWLYAFDPASALWAVLFIIPMEGAVRFQLRGALATWAVITILYSGREIWGSARYDYPLDWTSVSYRMGIALLIALIAGYMARDMTRQRALVCEALSEMTRVDHLRSALVSTLAHDVRNPLTTIRGVNYTLMKKWSQLDPETAAGLLASSDRQAQRLERLAIDLLDLARLEQGRIDLKIEKVEVRSAVERALSYVEGGDRFSISIDPGVTARADPDRLEQMLVNLGSNALRHGEPPFCAAAETIGNRVAISIRDSGRGVPENMLYELFEPFRTEGARGKGSVGFGLAVVKALAEASGGSVTYEAGDPEGAWFRLELPAGTNP
ncbi:MAG: HAMP domain-containing histidine kinase, partial [Actinomycetota bacterium]|nr:HAMP domain-containing histidine kinase [Actinomycetota bacterium]